MPLENASTISQLDSTWPLGLDSSSRGDDHLRLIKSVLKNQFPGVSGMGFSKPITATEDEINALPESVKKMGDTLFPVGSVVFRMDAVNPGSIYGGNWKIISADACLSFGNGSAMNGAPYGNNNPGVPLPYHDHGVGFNLYTTQSGDHQHGGVPARQRVEVGGSTDTVYSVYADGATFPAGNHAHTVAGGIQVHGNGVGNATIDVRGARLAINVWQRTA